MQYGENRCCNKASSRRQRRFLPQVQEYYLEVQIQRENTPAIPKTIDYSKNISHGDACQKMC